MNRFAHWIDRILIYALIILMAVIVIDVSWQVLTRFVLRHPSSYTEELATFLLIWIGVLGASYALRTKSHLGIDLLAQRLKNAKRYLLELFVNVCVFLFAFCIMVIGGIRLVMLTFHLNQLSAAIGIRMGYVYLVIPVSGALMMFYASLFIHQTVRSWIGHESPPPSDAEKPSIRTVA